jgi:hypothetical protein
VSPLSLTDCRSADSFRLSKDTAQACLNKGKPCKVVQVKAGQTLEQVAALYGTTTWQIWNDNFFMESAVDGKVSVRPHDVLAVRPSPGLEKLRWRWTDKAGLARRRCTSAVCWTWAGSGEGNCMCCMTAHAVGRLQCKTVGSAATFGSTRRI